MQILSLSQMIKFTGVALVISLTVPVLAQNPPARTYKPGYWQPIARVNSNSPVTVTLVNQTKFPLTYSLLDERGEKKLAVGAIAQMKITTLPINIAIYDASPQASAGDDTRLKYETSVTKNSIKVNVVPTTDEGSNVLNISKTGAVYAY
jgi:hypothetical protein